MSTNNVGDNATRTSAVVDRSEILRFMKRYIWSRDLSVPLSTKKLRLALETEFAGVSFKSLKSFIREQAAILVEELNREQLRLASNALLASNDTTISTNISTAAAVNNDTTIGSKNKNNNNNNNNNNSESQYSTRNIDSPVTSSRLQSKIKTSLVSSNKVIIVSKN
jgi:hypothetical protein